MSFTQAQLDALDAAIASGTVEVEYDGKRVRYRSMEELRTARKIVAEGLAQASGARRPRVVTPVFDRGV